MEGGGAIEPGLGGDQVEGAEVILGVAGQRPALVRDLGELGGFLFGLDVLLGVHGE